MQEYDRPSPENNRFTVAAPRSFYDRPPQSVTLAQRMLAVLSDRVAQTG